MLSTTFTRWQSTALDGGDQCYCIIKCAHFIKKVLMMDELVQFMLTVAAWYLATFIIAGFLKRWWLNKTS